MRAPPFIELIFVLKDVCLVRVEAPTSNLLEKTSLQVGILSAAIVVIFYEGLRARYLF